MRGFYFPGQFFAVLIVLSRPSTWVDLLALSIAMVLAATIGSLINYELGLLDVGLRISNFISIMGLRTKSFHVAIRALDTKFCFVVHWVKLIF